MTTIHIESDKSQIAKKVIMPGDPDRAKYIADTFLTDAKLVNNVRGESAYTGFYKGERITVFSSGMGIPSMGIYSHELFNDYDVDYIIRVGTAGSYVEDIKIKDIFLTESAYSETSYDEETVNENLYVVNASIELNSKIEDTALELNIDLKRGRAHTTEAFYGYDNASKKPVNEFKAYVVEMETYSLLLNAKKFHKQATSLLTVTDSFTTKESISREDRVKKLDTTITLALETLINL